MQEGKTTKPRTKSLAKTVALPIWSGRVVPGGVDVMNHFPSFVTAAISRARQENLVRCAHSVPGWDYVSMSAAAACVAGVQHHRRPRIQAHTHTPACKLSCFCTPAMS